MGLIYMNARYYLPNTNRMVSPDSIIPDPANPQSWNRYTYSYNNPLTFIDPTGHIGICFQQGPYADAEDETALHTMCTELGSQGYFGSVYTIIGNDFNDIVNAEEWLLAKMEEYPDEMIYVMGFSWGGSGALEFVNYIHDRSNTADAEEAPNIQIDALILIDAVPSLRSLKTRLGGEYNDSYSLPPNVGYTLNLYATNNAYGHTTFDKGITTLDGAFNIGVEQTNHCSIAYESCTRLPREWFPPHNSWPQPASGRINQNTLEQIKQWLTYLWI